MEQVPISNAYIWALTIFVAFLLIAILVACIIPYKPNNPGTTARRIWFWILAVATPIVGFIISKIFRNSKVGTWF